MLLPNKSWLAVVNDVCDVIEKAELATEFWKQELKQTMATEAASWLNANSCTHRVAEAPPLSFDSIYFSTLMVVSTGNKHHKGRGIVSIAPQTFPPLCNSTAQHQYHRLSFVSAFLKAVYGRASVSLMSQIRKQLNLLVFLSGLCSIADTASVVVHCGTLYEIKRLIHVSWHPIGLFTNRAL